FEDLPVLGNFREAIISRYGKVFEPNIPETAKDDKQDESITYEIKTIKTALCIESREGIIYIFIPPMEYLEHYLDLVASIESTALKLNIPVRIEGYEQPRDSRME